MNSSLKKMCNEISQMEKKSTMIIPPNNYYIVKLELHSPCRTTSQSISELSMLTSEPKPIIVYHSSNIILFLFSCLTCEENSDISHQCEGDHATIISKYVLRYCDVLTNFNVRIIHFDSQSEIISYISCIIFQTSRDAMKNLSNKITAKDINFKTDTELKLQLEEQGINWDTIEPHKKFGTIIKLSNEKNSKTSKDSIMKMSEMIDFRENKKYTKFIFGV